MDDRHFGEMVRNVRKVRGWSQEKLAAETGLSTQAISNIERGQSSPTLATVVTIARTLGMTLENFIPVPQEEDVEQSRADLVVQISALVSELDAHGLSILLDQAKVIRPYFKKRRE